MDVKDYIASGILELYVAGQLSEKENLEVAAMAEKHPEVRTEIEEIEQALIALAGATAPDNTADFESLRQCIQGTESRVVSMESAKIPWYSYMGWAASVVLAIGLLWMYNSNRELKEEIEAASGEKFMLEEQIANATSSLEETQRLFNALREQGISVVPLAGQEVSPTSYAKVYWNKEDKTVYVDAQGLPEPPPGMVYQVWSLKLDPLTPTSVGLLADFTSDSNRIFPLPNPNDSEAFGITLEPAGGSETPTLEQLYTLGVASS